MRTVPIVSQASSFCRADWVEHSLWRHSLTGPAGLELELICITSHRIGANWSLCLPPLGIFPLTRTGADWPYSVPSYRSVGDWLLEHSLSQNWVVPSHRIGADCNVPWLELIGVL